MPRMSLRKWATLYRVAHRNEKQGFLRYTAVIRCRGKELRVPELRYPFGPSLKEALRDHVEAAQVAEAFHGGFAAYRHAQGRSESPEAQAARFAPGAKARADLYEVFGKEAARVLLLQVKEFL